MTKSTPACILCDSTNVAEQPGNIFPGLYICQEPGCDGFYLNDVGAMAFQLELEHQLQQTYGPDYCGNRN